MTILTDHVEHKAENDQSSLPGIINQSDSHPCISSQSVLKDESESDIIPSVIDQSNTAHTINQSDAMNAISQSEKTNTINQSDVVTALIDQSNVPQAVDSSNFSIGKSDEAPIELILNLSGENNP